MTIAIGLLASDGIVVAADTQITAGTGKTTMGKIGAGISSHGDGVGSCIVAGAGSVVHMRHCSGLLQSVFMDRRGLVGDSLQDAVTEELARFHETHIVPFSNVPFDERPSATFILAYQRKDHVRFGRRTIPL